MTMKAWHPPDSDDLIQRYLSGESAQSLGRRYGLRTSQPVLRFLRQAGVPTRDQRTAARAVSQSMAWYPPYPNELIHLYLAGESIKALAERYGVTRGPVTRFVKGSGIPLRDIREANRLAMAKRTPEERKKYAEAAHTACRGKPQTFEHRCKIALAKEQTKAHVSSDELLLQEWLKQRDRETVLQKAIGPYNTDLASDPVAVEIFGGNWHARGRHAARFPERARYILDQGWNLVIVWVMDRRRWQSAIPLTPAAADYIAAFVEQARRNPTLRGQYRVIWGDGKEAATDGLELHELALVPSRRRSYRLRT